VLLAKAINHQRRDNIGREPVTDPPEGVTMTSGLDLPRNMDLPRIAGIGSGITALCHMGNIGVRWGAPG
jgi:hypothetical protein